MSQHTVTHDTHDATDLSRFRQMIARSQFDLKDHQLTGVQWMRDLETRGASGGLLADDMGLGKTIMLLGLLVENPKHHTLIVVPLALLHQWRDQITLLLGHTPLVFHGAAIKRITRDQLNAAPVVLTTYGHISGASPRTPTNESVAGASPRTPTNESVAGASYRTPGNLLLGGGSGACPRWNRVIYDEAHHLRNRRTTRYLGAAALRTDTTWLVTGTPVQNRKDDIVSLAQLLDVAPETLVADRMLRRSKTEAGISLPGVTCHQEPVDWSCVEEKQFVEQLHSEFTGFRAARSRPVSNQVSVSFRHPDTDPSEANHCVLAALNRCRQGCTFPELLKKSIVYDTVPPHTDEDAREQVGEASFYDKALNASSKLDAVVDHILYSGASPRTPTQEDIVGGSGACPREACPRRKLVFCTFRGEMDCIYERLAFGPAPHGRRLRVQVVDGRTSMSQRAKKMRDCDVLILQIQTACEGLNLQEFSDVYFVSPHWNPFVEAQAIGRCHRIGQTREVRVFRFFMDGSSFRPSDDRAECAPLTADNYIQEKQTAKRDLAAEILSAQ